MNTKVNSLATMIKIGVDVKTAMSAIDFFLNLAEAIACKTLAEHQVTTKQLYTVSFEKNNDCNKELRFVQLEEDLACFLYAFTLHYFIYADDADLILAKICQI